ncbi:MAG: four helix bundle protein [Alphaproteobacteria bacterium]
MVIQNYRDLVVWQKAMELANMVLGISEKMPSSQRYVLCAQMERSAISVPANIAEGRSRHSENDFIYHLNVARGSLAELETLLMIAQQRKYIEVATLEKAMDLAQEITKMLHKLKSSIRESANVRLAKT